MRTLTEFLEAMRAGRRASGYDASLITVEDPAEIRDSSGTMRYGVVMMPRRPRPKAEAPQD